MNFIDFSQEPYWHSLFYGTPSEDDPKIAELERWLKEHKNDFVRLYHGTSADHRVMEKGLLPTCHSRKHSLQSRNGYVSLSVYPGMAKQFGEMSYAYPKREIEVYAVTLCIKSLVADKDQLANQRQYAERHVKDTLAHSLVFGHGAQVKGKIEPYYIQPMSILMKDEIFDAVSKSDYSRFMFALDFVKSPDLINQHGMPLLSLAAAKGQHEMVRRLIEKGADVNIRDKQGDGPLVWAAISGSLGVAKFLLLNDADIYQCNYEGKAVIELLEIHHQIHNEIKLSHEIVHFLEDFLKNHQEQQVLESLINETNPQMNMGF